MSPDASPSSDAPPWRSWDWVSSDTFAATPFYRRGWDVLKNDWLVFLWKFGADFVSRIATVAFAVLIVVLLVVDLQPVVSAGLSPRAFGDHLAETLSSPGVIAGFTGSLFFLALATTALQALVTGGIWGILGDGLHDRPIRMGSSFLRRAVEWFPDVFSLFLLRFALRVVTSMLGTAMLIGLYRAWTTGGLGGLEGWQLTAVLAAGATLYLAWAGLSRLVVWIVGAPLVLDDVDLGEALLRGAAFVLDNFWSLYRLLVFALGMMLIPLGVYWLFIMVNNLSLAWPALAPVGSTLQFLGEILVFAATTVVGVLFYGAVFAFYRHDDQQFDPDAPPAGDDTDSGPDAPESGGDDPSPAPFRQGVTLSELTPDEAPRRVSFDEVLSDRPAADPDESTEPTAADSAPPSQDDAETDRGPTGADTDPDSASTPEEDPGGPETDRSRDGEGPSPPEGENSGDDGGRPPADES